MPCLLQEVFKISSSRGRRRNFSIRTEVRQTVVTGRTRRKRAGAVAWRVSGASSPRERPIYDVLSLSGVLESKMGSKALFIPKRLKAASNVLESSSLAVTYIYLDEKFKTTADELLKQNSNTAHELLRPTNWRVIEFLTGRGGCWLVYFQPISFTAISAKLFVGHAWSCCL